MTDIFKKTTLDPRDAIHIASMKELGLSFIVSEDNDFDKVDRIKRVNVSKCIKNAFRIVSLACFVAFVRLNLLYYYSE